MVNIVQFCLQMEHFSLLITKSTRQNNEVYAHISQKAFKQYPKVERGRVGYDGVTPFHFCEKEMKVDRSLNKTLLVYRQPGSAPAQRQLQKTNIRIAYYWLNVPLKDIIYGQDRYTYQ